MLTISFRRKSVCMGDDAGNGEWHIDDYCCDEHTRLMDLGITWTFGNRI